MPVVVLFFKKQHYTLSNKKLQQKKRTGKKAPNQRPRILQKSNQEQWLDRKKKKGIQHFKVSLVMSWMSLKHTKGKTRRIRGHKCFKMTLNGTIQGTVRAEILAPLKLVPSLDSP